MLSSQSTKREEIEHLQAFVEDLPTGTYLHGIIGTATPEIISMIQSDYSYSYDFRALESQAKALQEEKAELEKSVGELRAELAAMKQQKQDAQSALNSIREDADEVASRLRRYTGS